MKLLFTIGYFSLGLIWRGLKKTKSSQKRWILETWIWRFGTWWIGAVGFDGSTAYDWELTSTVLGTIIQFCLNLSLDSCLAPCLASGSYHINVCLNDWLWLYTKPSSAWSLTWKHDENKIWFSVKPAVRVLKRKIYMDLNVRKWKVKITQFCPTLCDPMIYIVQGILHARILEWDLPNPGIEPKSPALQADSLPASNNGYR